VLVKPAQMQLALEQAKQRVVESVQLVQVLHHPPHAR
jgi:hypothetical protein